MTDTQVRLPHFPYFEALAKTSSEDDPDWRSTKAGLLVLRLLDNWAMWGAEVITGNEWSVHVVRRSVTLIDDGSPLRGLLMSVLDGMRKSPESAPSEVIPQLMAYARGLEFDAKWALAADVYETIIHKVAQPVVDAPSVIKSYMALGACYRMLANWNEATAAYKAAGSLAKLRGDTESVIRSEISMANLSTSRGNLPQAEKILDRAIAHAETAGLEEIHAMALHARAEVAHHRGQYTLAIRLAYQALNGLSQPVARDRVLADIAASFFELGLTDAARDAHMILAATAQEQYLRWLSAINLLEIAATDRNQAAFEQYRHGLVNAPLPVSLLVHYHYYTGQGYRVFGKIDMAIQSLEAAVSTAAKHNLNEVL
ncbi:MAG TPA: hypothetical protein VF166_12525, partial [Gemmatimonadaceae bacterium]